MDTYTVAIQREYKLECRYCEFEVCVDSSVGAERTAASHVHESPKHVVEITPLTVVRS
jgi:hypothetical protein